MQKLYIILAKQETQRIKSSLSQSQTLKRHRFEHKHDISIEIKKIEIVLNKILFSEIYIFVFLQSKSYLCSFFLQKNLYLYNWNFDLIYYCQPNRQISLDIVFSSMSHDHTFSSFSEKLQRAGSLVLQLLFSPQLFKNLVSQIVRTQLKVVNTILGPPPLWEKPNYPTSSSLKQLFYS